MSKTLYLHQVSEQDLTPLEALLPPAYPEQFADMARCLYLTLKSNPAASEALNSGYMAQIAIAQVEAFCAECGGANMYVPKNIVQKTWQRNAQIIEEFDGSNIRRLSRRYKLSEERIRQILEKNRLQGVNK